MSEGSDATGAGSEASAGAVAPNPAASTQSQRYGTIVVVGGGCYGSYYARQLGRSVAAGALSCEAIVVVDRDPDCRVGVLLRDVPGAAAAPPESGPPPQQQDAAAVAQSVDQLRAAGVRVTLAESDWASYIGDFLARAAERPASRDAIVPSPLMPHLLFDWLLRRAQERWPARPVRSAPLGRAPSTPWERASPDGTHFVSFAEWLCPINCVEPPLCPEIRGPRTWSMPPAVRAYVAAEQSRGAALQGPVVFHCTHRAWGVGMIDVADVLAGDQLVAALGAEGAARVLVGTVSHCHGALSVLEVGA